jgi:polyisoprenoid-binding protein YceI
MKKLLFVTTCVVVSAGLYINASTKSFTPSSEPQEISEATDTTRWTVDPAHSKIRFTATHMALTEVEGQFKQFNGKMSYAKPDMSDADIVFVVDVKSLDTDNQQRDTHLRGDDFFNADKYPKITFKSTSFTAVDNERKNYKLTGKLTIRDVTKDVTWDVTHAGTRKDAYGNNKSGFKATTSINRFDYNLKWNQMTENIAIVGETIDITVHVQMKQEKPATSPASDK